MEIPPEKERKLGKLTCALLRSWFYLTTDEQKAVVIVLALLTIGIIARFLHIVGQV